MLNFAAALLTTLTSFMTMTGKKVERVKNILQHRNIASVLSVFMTCATIFLLTGALYFRNEVTIIDNGNTYKVFTIQTTPENILAEQGFKLTGLDNFSFKELENNKSTLTINRSFPITIRADGGEIEAEALPGETVEKVLARNNIMLAKRDLTAPSAGDILSADDELIRVIRAFEITIYIDGETMALPVTPDGRTTVSDVLSLEGINLGNEVITTQRLSAYASPGMEADISLVTYINRTVIGTIPYETITHTTNLRQIGDTEVLVQGVPGTERLTIIDTVVNGIVVDSEVVAVQELSKPVTAVVNKGMALAEPFSKRDFDEIELFNGLPVNYEFKLSGKASAYTAPPPGGTASGRPLLIGTVAVNPRQIPYGSLLYIVSQCGEIVYGAAIAADTGSFIYTTDVIVDVFKGFANAGFELAVEWGIRHVDIYVINMGIY